MSLCFVSNEILFNSVPVINYYMPKPNAAQFIHFIVILLMLPYHACSVADNVVTATMTSVVRVRTFWFVSTNILANIC